MAGSVWLLRIISHPSWVSLLAFSRMALRSGPPIHLPLIFSAPSSASFCQRSSSALAAGRSESLGFSSMNFCQMVTAARAVLTLRVLRWAMMNAGPPVGEDGAAAAAAAGVVAFAPVEGAGVLPLVMEAT